MVFHKIAVSVEASQCKTFTIIVTVATEKCPSVHAMHFCCISDDIVVLMHT